MGVNVFCNGNMTSLNGDLLAEEVAVLMGVRNFGNGPSRLQNGDLLFEEVELSLFFKATNPERSRRWMFPQCKNTEEVCATKNS